MALPEDLNDREHRKFRNTDDGPAVAVVGPDGSSIGGGGLGIGSYDYVSMALSAGDTTETYTFKTGGSGGTTVATVVLVYTDSTRDVLSSVTKS